MKKIFILLISLVCAFLFSCQTMPEMQVAQMQNYFVEPCSGGNIFFEKYGDNQKAYAIVDAQIEKNLNALGYCRVQKIEDAQFVLSPRYYPESFDYPDPFAHKPDEVYLSRPRGVALNFAIRVKATTGKFLLSCDTRIKIIPETLTVANIERQVDWALRYFPQCKVKITQ